MNYLDFLYNGKVINLNTIENSILDSLTPIANKEALPVKVTSGIDSSTRFIGSHISVLKPYILNNNLPKQGLKINQPCFKTKNLSLYKNFNEPLFGSLFMCQGSLSPANFLDTVPEALIDLLLNVLSIPPQDICILASSSKPCFTASMSIFKRYFEVRWDTLKQVRYTHQYGIENLTADLYRVSIFNHNCKDFREVLIVTLFTMPSGGQYVEVATSSSSLLQQMLGLDHVFDCYPFPACSHEFEQKRRVQDLLMSCMYLFYEGLEPSNKHNRNRLFKQYLMLLNYDLSSKSRSFKCELVRETEKYLFGQTSEVSEKMILAISI